MSIPKHVAIIPDGNRRWAKARRLNPWDGHIEGVNRFWETSDYAHELGVPQLTFWAASYDNLKKRSRLEVRFLLGLIEKELSKPEILERCFKNKVRAQVIGEWREFVASKKLIATIENLENQTAHFTKKGLNILLAYDGQREMLAAVVKTKNASSEELRKNLWTGELPDVDLVIRTGGEPHWSAGFMMWLTANSQFYFTEQLWPDFKKQELKKALVDYERRERRLGK
jgi:undecaprenyl diphosphate synthase